MAQRVDDRRGRTVDRHLANALRAERSMLVRVAAHHDVHRRRIERRRNDVVRERGVRHPAVAHDDLFEQRVAQSLRAAALDLPGGEQRMNRPAKLVHARERDRLHFPRVAIDLQLHDVAGPAVSAIGIAPVAGVVPRHAGWPFVLLRDDQRPVLAQILPRGEPAQARAHLLRAPLQDTADHHAGARGDGRPAVGHDAGVGGVHLDAVVRQAQRICHDLRMHRPGALTDLGARDQDPGAAIRERQ